MSDLSPRIENYDWGRMEWLADHESHPNTQTSLAKMIVAPGADTPLHMHDNCSELLHVLAGEVALQVSDYDPIPLGSGDTHLIPTFTPHSLRNAGEDEAVLMLSFSSPDRHYQVLSRPPLDDHRY